MTSEQCDRYSGGELGREEGPTALVEEMADRPFAMGQAVSAVGSERSKVNVGSTHFNRSSPSDAGQPGMCESPAGTGAGAVADKAERAAVSSTEGFVDRGCEQDGREQHFVFEA